MHEPIPPPGFPAEIPSPDTLDALHAVMRRCTRCALYQSRTHVVPGAGDPDAEVLFVGEAPGAAEDQEGIPFIGRSGLLLDEMLAAGGIRRDRVFIASTVRCRPPRNRDPRTREVRACAGWVAEQIRLIDPTLVVPLGRFGLQHFLPGARITLLQATLQEVEYGTRTLRLFPLLHPSAILRNPKLRDRYAEQFRELGQLMRS